jgi:hypothetical protein
MSSATTPHEPSLGELFGRVTGDLSTLVRQEIQLAKVEITQEVRTAGKAGGLLGGSALTGYLALLFVSVALALGLAELVPAWVAFLIVGALYGIAAAVLMSKGRQELEHVDPVPQQTVETLKEDVQWAKSRRR